MTSPIDPAGRTRAEWLDLLKTLLVYGMVTAHVIQLITARPRPEALIFSEVINLITFSGFMFAFGLGLGLSGERRAGRGGWWRLLQPAVILLLGTYASSIAFVTLVERDPLTPDLLFDLLTMRRLFGWSEFLASFFVLYLLLLLARGPLLFIASRLHLLLAAIVLCALSTYLVTSVDFPLIATIIGTRNFASFPLLAYFPWLLIGIWLARRSLDPRIAGLGLLGTALYYLYALGTEEYPSRFPPSILFVAGSAAFLLVYLLLSRWIAGRVKVPGFLLIPGRHVFSFLIVSNLVIFATRWFYFRPLRETLSVLLASVAILAALTIAWWLIERGRGGARSPQQA